MVKFFPDPYDPRDQLFLSTGEAWRRRRQTLTPAFSASKMKMVLVIMCVFVAEAHKYHMQMRLGKNVGHWKSEC